MKKALSIILTLIMCIFLCACDDSYDTSKCTICKKTATNTFQGSGYCTEHYKDAIVWAMNNVSN